MALPWASERVREDRSIVLIAVTNAGAALEFASQELRGCKEVVVAAVTNDALAMLAVDVKLKCDKAFAIHLVQHNNAAIPYSAKEVREDADVISAAFSRRQRPWSAPKRSPRALADLQRMQKLPLAPSVTSVAGRVGGGGG